MKLKEEYIGCNIHQPKTRKIINVNDVDNTEYPFYYLNGYSHLFEKEDFENNTVYTFSENKEETPSINTRCINGPI